MSSKYRPVTHCIFDMDGLLLDTESLYTVMTQSIIDKFHENPRKIYTIDVQARLLGVPMIEEGRIITKLYDLPITAEKYVEMSKEIIPKLMQNCAKCRGAEALVRHLHASKIPMCVATASAEDSFLVKSANHRDIFALFDHVVLGGSDAEVANGKPAPDIFLVAARRFAGHVKPENCLVFEDSPAGVKAARAAGMQCVMVPDPKIPEENKLEATVVLESLDDFRPEDFGLPCRK